MRPHWLLSALSLIALGGTASALEKVSLSPNEIRPTLIGQQIPDARVRTMDGKEIRLRTFIAEKPTVLVVVRGGWCPFCNRQLSQLRRIQEALLKTGYRIVAISPDRLDGLKDAVTRNELGYTVLSDAWGEVSRGLGVAFSVSAADFGGPERFAAWQKTRSPELIGQQPPWLPVPSVYLLHRSGRTIFQYVNVDYQVRLSGEVLLTAARAYAEKTE